MQDAHFFYKRTKQSDSYQKQNDQKTYLVNLTMQIGIGVKLTRRLEAFMPSDIKNRELSNYPCSVL